MQLQIGNNTLAGPAINNDDAESSKRIMFTYPMVKHTVISFCLLVKIDITLVSVLPKVYVHFRRI